jgi:hypothetical protein
MGIDAEGKHAALIMPILASGEEDKEAWFGEVGCTEKD